MLVNVGAEESGREEIFNNQRQVTFSLIFCFLLVLGILYAVNKGSAVLLKDSQLTTEQLTEQQSEENLRLKSSATGTSRITKQTELVANSLYRYASLPFEIASILLLVAIVGSVMGTMQVLLFAAFALGFAIKVPMFPFHTWLPDAHVEAPTAGSVILAGILLKLGTYGFYRFNLPMFPGASKDQQYFGSFGVRSVIVFLAIVSILYGALAAMYFVVKKDGDVKKLVAYSSVSSMGMLAHVFLWPLASLLYLHNTIAAGFSRQIEWRGITYELKSPNEAVIIGRRDQINPGSSS